MPLALVMTVCLRVGIPKGQQLMQKLPFDLFGLVSGGAGLALIYAALDQGNRLDWLNSPLVWSLLCAGVVLVIAFLIHERVTPTPLVDLRVVFGTPMPSQFALIAFLRLTILATAFLIPLYLSSVRGFRSLEVGDTLIWVAVPQLIICPLAALMLRRTDARLVAAIGFVFISVACLMVAYGITPIWGTQQFLPSQLLQAVGQSFAISGVIFYGILHLRPQDALTFGAVLQTARLMGGELGIAFMSTWSRVREQVASNLIGQHLRVGDSEVMDRVHAYAAATSQSLDAAAELLRGHAILAENGAGGRNDSGSHGWIHRDRLPHGGCAADSRPAKGRTIRTRIATAAVPTDSRRYHRAIGLSREIWCHVFTLMAEMNMNAMTPPVPAPSHDPASRRRDFLRGALMAAAVAQIGVSSALHAAAKPSTRTAFGSYKQVRAGLLNVGYAEEGPTTGPVVILLHGWPYDIHSFLDSSAVLTSAGYRVIVPYLRGYGTTRFLSDQTTRNGQQSALGTDVVDLMDALGIRSALLAGFDWGARTAAVVAALWPDRCRALVSVSGYLITNLEFNKQPLPPSAELGWWYQYYFATERGRVGYDRNRREFAKLIWKIASPRWAFDDATFERSAAGLRQSRSHRDRRSQLSLAAGACDRRAAL